MKSIFIGFTFILLFSIRVQEVRKLYPQAIDDALITENLYEHLSSINLDGDIVLYGYKGAVSTLKAKHAKGLKNKKNFFSEGVTCIEAAIKAKPENLELRFIRLSVQENAPKIVKYRDKIKEDKKIILQGFSQIKESSIKELIHNYAMGSEGFTEEEKTRL